MKHIKLFESFGEASGKYQLGYFSEGGYGSHPGILTEDDLIKNGFVYRDNPLFINLKSWVNQKDDFKTFTVIDTMNIIPGAISLIFEDGMWNYSEVPVAEAERLISEIGGDTVYPRDGALYDEALSVIGFSGSNQPESISFIVGPKPGFIYWSDNPEETHGYWENGNPVRLEELVR
jgi:hypothetical protein